MVFVHFENGELVPENVVLVYAKNYQFAVKVVTDRSSVLPFCPNRTEQVNQSSVSRNQTEKNQSKKDLIPEPKPNRTEHVKNTNKS